MKRTLILAAVATAVAGQVQARDYISIVGSSTVYPFATVVAEQFGKTTDFKTPKIESTGSGGGLKLFCSGVGVEHPDVTNASRRIKTSELEKCAGNGVTDIVEVKIGYDGIVFANSRKSEPVRITRKQVFLALAKNVPDRNGGETLVPNPYMKWSDVDASLPDSKIEVLGPPPTSGTRDAFAELALEGGCKTIDWIKAMKKSDRKKYKATCHTVREDGGYVEAGENDNLIVQKLDANPRRVRRVRIQLPRPELRQDPGVRGRRREADVREHRRPVLSGLSTPVLLREEGACRSDSRHRGVSGPSSPATRPGAKKATSRTRA